jgi:hypothetical protein
LTLYFSLVGTQKGLIANWRQVASRSVASLAFSKPRLQRCRRDAAGFSRGFHKRTNRKEPNPLPKRGNPGGISVNLDPIFGIVIFWQYAKLGKLG